MNRLMVTAGLIAFATSAFAAEPIYRDLNRSFEERSADLVSRMTLEEKVLQLRNDAPAIARLDVPAYEWWNEALHGVARAGSATVFPQAIGLAATFDTRLMREIAIAIGDEARAKHHEFAGRGLRKRYQGLTFWSPNINIFRDPRWGRGQETYGEDPYLTARMGVEFVKALQGDDPKYVKVFATAKHFAVHSGPELDRHRFDARPSERDLYETYLPAFQSLVVEGKVGSVMGAYNRVNGESASASPRLLQQILRKDWGFNGYVVSDCDSIDDIFRHHKIVATAEEAAALGVRNGCDLDCGKTYDALTGAVKQGLISETEISAAVQRLMLARFQLGMFDPPEKVRWAQIPYSVNQSAKHDALSRRSAQASMVLLKNSNKALPLSKNIGTLAVIGPTADEVSALLGNYYGTPAAPVTILQGIRAAVSPQTKVIYARGADLVEGRDDPRAEPLIDARYLKPALDSRERGLKGEYFRGLELAGDPALTRTDSQVNFRWDRGSPTDDLVARGEMRAEQGLANDQFSVRWSGYLTPPVSGRYDISMAADDGFRLFIDDKPVLDGWTKAGRLQGKTATIELVADQPVKIRVEYFEDARDAEVRLSWRLPGGKDIRSDALAAAAAADAIVFVGGLTADVEGEEMKVNYPGFAGGDRTDIRLPATQRSLLEALHATGKPVILVLTTGAPLAIDWEKANLQAILLAWYPGQRGGTAVADVLFGDANPAGRLPVTFYRADEKLPAFDDYDMKGRTYRYFQGAALYPFGYGLSYTSFGYRQLKVDRNAADAAQKIRVNVTVANTGKRDGEEVVQLYVRAKDSKNVRARKELRGVERVALKAGETKRVDFELIPGRDFTYYSEQRKAYAVDPGVYEVQVGASSEDIRARVSVRVK